ncbi:MAG TPA: FkbM family methyltransferase [Terracidiphilus sp.]|nr:FkbM family methyltransferase [Terracidiphilus sp.]
MVIAKLRYGAQAVVFANEYIGRSMYLWGEHDPRITDVIDAVLRNGDSALDIGGNFGVTGIFIAKRVGSTGKVHLFEPQPLVASCLRTSLLINGYSHATVHECALSDRDGSAVMSVTDPSNMGMTTLSPINVDSMKHLQTISVRTKNAAEYMDSLECSAVALVKIDTEGHETVILASMREWLAKQRPPIIVFECHLDGHTFREQQSVEILSGLGYEFLGIDTKPLWHTRLFHINDKQQPAGYDFVAVLWQELDEDRRTALEALLI